MQVGVDVICTIILVGVASPVLKILLIVTLRNNAMG